jgi:hypothetical protein
MIVGTFNFAVVSTFGNNCGISPLEQTFLIPSMQRMLERMPAEAARRASVIIDPLVILTVLVTWGKRISSIKAEEAKEKYQIRPTEAARAAGVSGFTHSVPETNQETNDAANGVVHDEPMAVNGTYNAPQHIREGFSDAV